MHAARHSRHYRPTFHFASNYLTQVVSLTDQRPDGTKNRRECRDRDDSQSRCRQRNHPSRSSAFPL